MSEDRALVRELAIHFIKNQEKSLWGALWLKLNKQKELAQQVRKTLFYITVIALTC